MSKIGNRAVNLLTMLSFSLFCSLSASAQTSQLTPLMIQYREGAPHRVLNVTYGSSNNVVELNNVRVSAGDDQFDYGALQVRMPLTGPAAKCADGALLTQRVENIANSQSGFGRDVRIFGLGILQPNGSGEGIATMKTVTGCFFQ